MTLTDVPNKQFFRVGEAAELLGVHENTIRAWCERGYLRVISSPTYQRRITRASVESILKHAPVE